MKINLIIPSFYPATVYGGPIFSTLYTCEALSKLDDVEVYVSTTNANRESKLDVKINSWIKFEDGFFVKYYNTTLTHTISIPMFFNTYKDVRSSDVIHIQPVFNISSLFALVYARLFVKPVLLSPRGSLCEWCLAQGSSFKRFWMKFFIDPVGNNISWHATSEAEKVDILKRYPKCKVYIVPNGIEVDAFKKVTTLEKQVYLQKYMGHNIEASKIIVSMGRLHKVKGFDVLINAFTEILKTHSDAILMIAGKDVGEKENLDKLVQELKLEKNVYFIGEVSHQEKIDFLGNADLFVLPSHTENFGNVYVESLAAGTPIVASTGTPWQEVEEANCGKWVKNSVQETAQAMLEMLEKEREEMRINARALAKKYDWTNVALEFKKTFDQMLKGTEKNGK